MNLRKLQRVNYAIQLYEESTSEKIVVKTQLIKHRFGNISKPNEFDVYSIEIKSMDLWEKAKYLLGSNDYLMKIKKALLEKYPGAYLIYNSNGISKDL
jgi:hypothetical protein